MLQLFFYFTSLPTYIIQNIDTVTAKTTIRLWHEIHVCKKITHDFTNLLSTEVNGYYIAAVRYNEIRAIAIGPNPINLTLITSVPVNPICKMLEVLMMVLLFNLRLFLIIRVSVKARIDNVSGWFRWLSFLRFQFSRVFGVPRGFGCSYLRNV